MATHIREHFPYAASESARQPDFEKELERELRGVERKEQWEQWEWLRKSKEVYRQALEEAVDHAPDVQSILPKDAPDAVPADCGRSAGAGEGFGAECASEV